MVIVSRFAMAAACLIGTACQAAIEASFPDGFTEVYQGDLDGDGRMDRIGIHAVTSPDDRIHVDRIALVLTQSGIHMLSGSWAELPDAFQSPGNLLASRIGYLARFPSAGNLLFVFGPQDSLARSTIQVLGVSSHGVQRYFQAESFTLFEAPVPIPDRLATLAGLCCRASPDPLRHERLPLIVYRLGESIELDVASTLIRRRYGK